MRAAKGVVVLLVVCLLAAPAWAASSGNRQAPRQAELNLLRSPRMLGRWRASFLDAKTKLLRPNIVVHCAGVGRSSRGRYHTLRCSVTLPPWRVRLRYIALGRYGFIARHVRATRA